MPSVRSISPYFLNLVSATEVCFRGSPAWASRPVEAAVREVREEVGLVIKIDDSHMTYRLTEPGYRETPPVLMCRVRVSDAHEHVTLTYLARSGSDLVRPGGRDRSDVWRWFERAELDDPSWGLKEGIAFYARAALDRLGG